jgi:hypothetical protein
MQILLIDADREELFCPATGIQIAGDIEKVDPFNSPALLAMFIQAAGEFVTTDKGKSLIDLHNDWSEMEENDGATFEDFIGGVQLGGAPNAICIEHIEEMGGCMRHRDSVFYIIDMDYEPTQENDQEEAVTGE